MAKQLLVGANGLFVFLDPGPLAFYEPPTMLLTISGATGSITWCGETWNLPADSGLMKTVEPTKYTKSKVVTTDNTPSYGTQRKHARYQHSWTWTDGNKNAGLSLFRKWDMSSNQAAPWSVYSGIVGHVAVYPGPKNLVSPSYFGSGNVEWLGVNYVFDNGDWDNYAKLPGTLFNYVPDTTYTGNYYNLGALSYLSEPTRNDYTLTSRFFSSVIIEGITYTWAKGENW